MAKKLCPNCDFDISEQDLDVSPHCPHCGANLKAKKFSKADDPATTAKELADAKKRLAAIEADNATIKKTLQEREDEKATRDKRDRKTLFGN